MLSRCYKNCLKIAADNKISTIAFPAISTGVYRFPLERATNIAVKEVNDFVTEFKSIKKVIFSCFDEKTYQVYEKILGMST